MTIAYGLACLFVAFILIWCVADAWINFGGCGE